jgi:hypothetical protein
MDEQETEPKQKRLVRLIRQIAKEIANEILDEHLDDYEHKEKPFEENVA